MSDFVTQCLTGNVLLDEVDDFVDKWHDEDTDLSIHEFLGMRKAEYSLWVADPDVLPYIVKARQQNRDVSDLIDEANALPLAARSRGSQAADILKWLKSEGLWE